ncbi:MAG: sigma-54 dependent transcriptional regulator [Nannocystaceae bacterium]
MTRVAEPLLDGHLILVVDDYQPYRDVCVVYLEGLGCTVHTAAGGIEALARLRERVYDLVLLDFSMNDIDGLQVLKRAQVDSKTRNYVMMSGHDNKALGLSVAAVKLGAADFLVKPFTISQLTDTIRRVLRIDEGQVAGGDARKIWRDKFASRMIGDHEQLLKIFLLLERIAESDATVLIHGESGTGKELVAQALHDSSPRSKNDLIPLNCGAIPEAIIESELFGHARGAFSGAVQNREGRFEAADHSTLFLDEIGEMSLAVQVKFLRVLQEGEFVRVGEARPRKADVRIVAATNKNLEQLADSGSFRKDLYFRLNTIPIDLPPLRERASDIRLLANHFLGTFNARRRRQRLREFSPTAMEAMSQYRWPGNIRELQNTIERMTLLYEGNGVLEVEDLPQKIQDALSSRSAHRLAPTAAVGGPVEAPQPTLTTPQPTPTRGEVDGVKQVGRESAPDVPDGAWLAAGSVAATDDPRAHTDPPANPDNGMAGAAPGVDGPHVSHNGVPTTDADATQPQAHYPYKIVLPDGGINMRDTLAKIEHSLILQAMERTDGNVARAARLLGMNRTTLVEKLRKHRARR